MGTWARHFLAIAAPLLLTGCLWGPGKFTAALALHTDGSFVLDYSGQMLVQASDDKVPAGGPWSNAMARCYRDGRTEIGQPPDKTAEPDASIKDDAQACTAAQLAKLKTEYADKAAELARSKRAENEQMAKLFGLPALDEESSRRFAAKLMKYQGWRSVVYRGGGVFDVVYHFAGRADQDFAFPMMPDSDLVMPFVAIRRRTDRTVEISAPALTGGSGPFGARAMAMGMPQSDEGPASHAQGRLTIVTNGEILTNNSEDGPVATTAGKQVHWDVGPESRKIPGMLVRL